MFKVTLWRDIRKQVDKNVWLIFSGLLVFSVCSLPVTNRLIKCPVYSLTNYYCPGCGSIRCLQSLLQGDFTSAWHQNALFLLSIFLIPTFYILKLTRKHSRTFLVMLVLIEICFVFIRNQPGSSLAPL